MERSQRSEDGSSKPGRVPSLDRVSGGVDSDFLLLRRRRRRRGEEGQRDWVSFENSIRLDATSSPSPLLFPTSPPTTNGERRILFTHTRSQLCHLPIKPIRHTGKQTSTSNEDDVGKETSSDVEVASHDGFGSEFGDGDDLVESVGVRG